MPRVNIIKSFAMHPASQMIEVNPIVNTDAQITSDGSWLAGLDDELTESMSEISV